MIFFEGRGRFAARSEYVGMDASSIPALFVEYFEGLSEGRKMEMARVIASGALGESEALRPHLAPATRLMGDLCLRNQHGFFQGSREALEKAFTDAANVKAWLEAPDPETDVQGSAFKKEWRYALVLWGMLYLLRSDKIREIYQTLLENAHSEHFQQSQVRARNVYDQLLQSR